jgi:hypothetical protein
MVKPAYGTSWKGIIAEQDIITLDDDDDDEDGEPSINPSLDDSRDTGAGRGA